MLLPKRVDLVMKMFHLITLAAACSNYRSYRCLSLKQLEHHIKDMHYIIN